MDIFNNSIYIPNDIINLIFSFYHPKIHNSKWQVVHICIRNLDNRDIEWYIPFHGIWGVIPCFFLPNITRTLFYIHDDEITEIDNSTHADFLTDLEYIRSLVISRRRRGLL